MKSSRQHPLPGSIPTRSRHPIPENMTGVDLPDHDTSPRKTPEGFRELRHPPVGLGNFSLLAQRQTTSSTTPPNRQPNLLDKVEDIVSGGARQPVRPLGACESVRAAPGPAAQAEASAASLEAPAGRPEDHTRSNRGGAERMRMDGSDEIVSDEQLGGTLDNLDAAALRQEDDGAAQSVVARLYSSSDRSGRHLWARQLGRRSRSTGFGDWLRGGQ